MLTQKHEVTLFSLRRKGLTVSFLFILVILMIGCGKPSKTEKGYVTDKVFDSIYFETAVTIAALDLNRAIDISDSLYNHSVSERHKLKALMLSSTLFQQKGEIKKSIQYAEMADQIAVRNKFYDWEARIAGFLSTQYRNLELFEQGEFYLEKGKKVSDKIKEEQQKVVYLGMIYEETAYYEIEHGNYEAAYKAALTAEEYFNRITDETNKNYFFATNEELFGRICIGLKKWDEALVHYSNSMESLSNVTQRDAVLNCFVYSGLGRVYLEKKETDLAIENLRKAEQLVENSNHLELKVEVYKTLSDYFRWVGNYSEYTVYHDKYMDAFQLSEKKKKQSIDNFISSVQSRERTLSFNRNVLLTLLSVLLVVMISSIFFYRRSKKRDFARFKAVMKKIQQEQLSKTATESESVEKKEQKKVRKKIMSEAVESKLLNDLEEFEKGIKFTDKQISLPVLAGILNTNTKYLSYVLNTHKNKDFSTYINELRINYIIKKMETDETFLHYKLSVLSNECGFSSHSKFSAVFKSVTGFSPSAFISYLEKSKNEK